MGFIALRLVYLQKLIYKQMLTYIRLPIFCKAGVSSSLFIMGYSFYIASKEKPISRNDFDTAMVNLSKFNKQGLAGLPVCDVSFDNPNYIRVSGSFGVSGQYAEGFVLNIVMCLLDLDYKPKVLSHDWEYGTKEDFEWLDSVR